MKKTKTIDEKIVDAILKVLKTECGNDPLGGLEAMATAFLKITFVTGMVLGEKGNEFRIKLLRQMIKQCEEAK